MSGPLSGLHVVSLGGIGPAPFAGMMLADLGADVLRIERKGTDGERVRSDRMSRGSRFIRLDFKETGAVEAVLGLVEHADVVTEGFRPGVAERLGVGPEVCLVRNPRLIYGRMTGWGQAGPLANAPGHDINYTSLSGILGLIGTASLPLPPLNVVEFGGGGMLLAFGIMAAVWEAGKSGLGQVIDAAVVDGAVLLAAGIFGTHQAGAWGPNRGSNVVDGGAPFYRVYETADGGFLSVGAIEPQFYREFLAVVGIEDAPLAEQMNRDLWPAMAGRLEAIFRTKSRDEWWALFEGTETCVVPVVSLDEAIHHPHNQFRGTFVEIDGVQQPASAPRFSRTPGQVGPVASPGGDDTRRMLAGWGMTQSAIDAMSELETVG